MRSVLIALSGTLFARASRVVNVNDNAEAVDLGENDYGEYFNDPSGFTNEPLDEDALLQAQSEEESDLFGKKLIRVDKDEIEKRFTSDDEPILVSGEHVDFAWRKGKHDILAFTTKRILKADAKLIFGKVNKIEYTSGLWRSISAWSVETAGMADRDVELTLHDAYTNFVPCADCKIITNPMITGQWDFDFDRNEDILVVNKYVQDKIMEAKVWQKSSGVGELKAHSSMWMQGAQLGVPNDMSKLKPITNDAGLKVLNKDGAFLMDGEEILYSFSETRWSRDHMFLTNKRAIVVDKKRGSKTKTHYISIPLDADPFAMINTWQIETAGKGDRDCEIRVGTIVNKRLAADFSSKVMSNKDLFALHNDFQKNLLV